MNLPPKNDPVRVTDEMLLRVCSGMTLEVFAAVSDALRRKKVAQGRTVYMRQPEPGIVEFFAREVK